MTCDFYVLSNSISVISGQWWGGGGGVGGGVGGR